MAKSSMKKPSGHKPAGGAFSSKNVSPKIRTGKGTEKIAEKGVSQIGQSFGNAAALVDIPAGRGMNPCKYGNELALNASGSKAGPGADRDIHPQGMQGVHSGKKGS